MPAVSSWQHIVEGVRKQCQLDVNSVVAQLIKLLEFKQQRLNNVKNISIKLVIVINSVD